jgi:outer membrane biosynthesis protein TonB
MATQQPQPPAAAPPPPRPRILRIGVLLGDKIVEEKLVRDRGPVSIGQSARNTFSIPAAELPRSWPLFQLHQGHYVLAAADSMDGRISDGGQVMTIPQLKATGRLARSGPAWLIPLSDNARGKIVIGDMTLLFQFVLAPPLQPRPMLPHSVRGSVADRIDPYLAVILSISLVLHGLVWAYCKYIVEEPPPTPPDVIADQFAHVVLERPKPPPQKTDLGKEEKPAEEKKAEPKRVVLPKKEATPDKEAIEAKVASAAPLAVLHQLAAKGNGPLGDVTGDKASWENLDKGLAKVGNANVVASVGSTRGATTRGAGSGEVAAGKEVGVTGPSGPSATGGEKVEKEIKVAGTMQKVEGESSGALDPDKVAQTIKARYQARVMACYQRGLKTNPTLQGKVTVSFTVGIAGNVVKANVEGFDAGIDDCIAREARTWRFNKPDEASEYEIPFVLRHL